MSTKTKPQPKFKPRTIDEVCGKPHGWFKRELKAEAAALRKQDAARAERIRNAAKTNSPLRAWDASDERVSPTSTAKSIANAMRDYADRWRANGTRVPADVLEVWAEFVEGQSPSQRARRHVKFKIVNDGYWYWEVHGRHGQLARSSWCFADPKSARRTVRRLFGPSVKVEVVK